MWYILTTTIILFLNVTIFINIYWYLNTDNILIWYFNINNKNNNKFVTERDENIYQLDKVTISCYKPWKDSGILEQTISIYKPYAWC